MADCQNIKGMLPFKTQLDFRPLLRYWEKLRDDTSNEILSATAQAVLEKAAQISGLETPIDDAHFIEKHQLFLQSLLSVIVPPGSSDTELVAVTAPFNYRFVYQSVKFQQAMSDCRIVNEQKKSDLKIGYTYLGILNKFYGITLDVQIPMVLEIAQDGEPFHRYFQMSINHQFLDIQCVGELPKLSEDDKKRIIQDITDIDFLRKKLPPEKFVLSGIIVIKAVEVTVQTILSNIKHLILERGSILSKNKFDKIQEMLRVIIGVDGLFLTIAALKDDQVLMLNKGVQEAAQCIFGGTEHYPINEFDGTVYEQAVTGNKMVFVSDLEKKKNRTEIDSHILAHGIRNILAVPLVYEGKIIGVLGLGSPVPGSINSLNAMLLHDLLPVFAHALERSLDEFEDRIQHMIQDKFTSIHPSVHWRFRQEAIRLIDAKNRGIPDDGEPILFERIYPLYSVTDIRSSSHFRNDAIQADLMDHLALARNILVDAFKIEKLPIFDEIIFRIDRNLESIRENLSTGDEIQIINFLKNRVESCFENIAKYNKEIAQKIEAYYKHIDPRAGTVYQRRRAYDDSVSMINTTISSYLEVVNQEAQQMYPHYFDKQATDGVDQNIYLGESMTFDRPYNPMYLKNMRLWQLIVMCDIAVKMEQLKPTLPVPLETTHLIMVQDMPLSIRFDVDEKKFRVDGAYNIRYEIMKKRIDKAVIKGSGERLTQPKKIAIVYSHSEEILEYLEFVAYLQSKDFLLPGVEEFELEDLQGIRGLKAIRVAIVPKKKSSKGASLTEMIGEALPV